MRPSRHNLSCDNEFYLHENEKHFHIKAEYLTSFWYRGPEELFKTFLDSGFHTVDSGFQILNSSQCGTWILDSLVGFRIPWAVFQVPKPSISVSTSRLFSGIRIPLVKTFRISESRFPHMARMMPLGKVAIILLSTVIQLNKFYKEMRNQHLLDK